MSKYKNMVFIISSIVVIICIFVLILVLIKNNSKNKEKFDSSIIVSSQFKRGRDTSNFPREKINNCQPCPPCPPCPNNNCKCNNCKCNNCKCNDDSIQYPNTFVAIGSNIIAWSDNGQNWNRIDSSSVFAFYDGLCLASNGNVWVGGCMGNDYASSIIFSSDNARTWASIPLTSDQNILGTIHAVAWNGTYFIAVGESFGYKSRAGYSEDGITWNYAKGDPVENNLFDFDHRLVAIACNKKISLIIAALGTIFGNPFISYSLDNGKTWNYAKGQQFNRTVLGSATSIAINDNNFCVAISGNMPDSNILISSNGITWTFPTTNIFYNDGDVLNCVAHDNLLTWVVVGRSGVLGRSGVYVKTEGIGYSIDNGQNWYVASGGDFIKNSFDCVAYNGKIWVASGTDYILYSYNGQKWAKSNANAGGKNLCWNGTIWVCGGPPILQSVDGINWNSTPDPDIFNNGYINSIACKF